VTSVLPSIVVVLILVPVFFAMLKERALRAASA
jgi:hypothetical protein